MFTEAKNRAKALLLRLQPIVRTDMSYAVKGGFWLAFSSAAGTLMSLAVVIAFANLAPKDTYGSYKYLMAVAGTLAGFTLSGLGEALMGAASRGNDGTLRRLVRRAFQWNTIIAAVAFAGAGWYFWHDNTMLGGALVAIGFFLPLTQSTGLFAAYLRGKRLFQVAAKYSVIRNLVPAIILIAALTIFPDNPAALVVAFMGSSALASYAAYRFVQRAYTKNEAVEPGALRFGAHASMMNVLGALAVHLDKIIIFQTLGAVPTAVYALAQALPDQIDGLTVNLRSLALPKFASQPPVGAFAPLLRKAAIVFLALVLVIAGVSAVAPILYQIVFPAYMEAVQYAIILLLSQPAIAASQLLMAFITAHKDVQARYLIGIVPSALSIALMLLLIKPLGLLGIVIAKVAVRYVGLVLALVSCARIARAPRSIENMLS